MTVLSATSNSRDFWGFYREYARSGVHAATAAGVTIFGLFASLYWEGFIVVAVAVYVLPLAYFYFAADRTEREPGNATPKRDFEDDASDPTTTSDSGPESTSPPEPGSNGEPSSGRARESASPSARTTTSAADATDDGRLGSSGNVANTERSTEGDSRTGSGTETGPVLDTDLEGEGTADGDDADGTTGGEPEWTTARSPTEEPLYDVVAARAVVAVGDDGVVLARHEDGWDVVLERGPTVESNPLWGVDAAEDGEHVWFCGDGGVLGQYDVGESRLTDRSAPRDRTDTWEDVAVVGPAGSEHVHLVNGSGEVLSGRIHEAELTWDEPVKPGTGSSLSSVEFRTEETGYCCDTSQGVFETTDGGCSWKRIGIDDAGTDFTDLAFVRDELLVATDDGSLFRYDDPDWTKLHVGEDPLYAIDWAARESEGTPSDEEDDPSADGNGGTGLLVGDDGAIYELVGNDWQRVDSPTDEPCYGVAVRPDGCDVAVGDDGTIVERGT